MTLAWPLFGVGAVGVAPLVERRNKYRSVFNRYGCFWLDDPVLTCFECGIDVMFCAETFSGRGRPPAPGARGAAHGLRCYLGLEIWREENRLGDENPA